ncbi:MAG TPA: hypothetical protein VK796_12695 [Cytophaga sp.]|jgi:hypothetical protein|nr:hypothetical protein [Cytophaga sp.]
MRLQTVIQNLAHPDTRATTASLKSINLGFDIGPQDFYLLAEKDFETDNTVNCLSNAKRALDAQVNSLLIVFGFDNKLRKSFPDKIEILNAVGVIAPRILLKINEQRNLLEHEFKRPNKDKVEDFLNITALFLASTSRYINNFPETASLSNKNPKFHLNIYLHYKTNQIEIQDSNYYCDANHINIAKYYLHFKDRENKFTADKTLNARRIILDIRNEEYKPLLKEYLRLTVRL